MIDRGDALLGIDLGTTVLKVCVLDGRSGEALAAAATRLAVEDLPGGGREQAVRSLDRALGSCVRAVRKRMGRRWRRVRGIGIAAQGGSSIIANCTTGEALTPMVLWNDGRTSSHAAEIASRYPRGELRRRTLGSVLPAGLGRLVWLRERRPELFSGENLHVGAGEHLFFRLTGIWRQDAGNAIQIGSYDARRGRLDPTLLGRIGIPLSFVAPLRRGHETSPLSRRGACHLGLEPGIPVAGPYIDQEAGYLSAVGAARSPLHISLGTAWVGNFILPPRFRGASPTQIVLPSPEGAGRLVVQPLLAGNAAWDWARCRLALKGSWASAERGLSRSLLPERGLVALPWLSRPNPLDPSAYGAGAFLGVSDRTASEDLLRAIACGLSFELFRVLGAIAAERVVGGIVLGGGASESRHLRTLIAALFAPQPVLHQQDEGASVARGSIFAFSKAAARARTRRVRPPPAAVREEVVERYETYRAAFETVYGDSPAGGPFTVRRRRR